MWTRVELKARAKEVLKTNYWKAFLVSIVIVIGLMNGNGSSYKLNEDGSSSNDILRYIIDEVPEFTVNYRNVFLIALGFALIMIAFRIFVGFSLEVGGRKYFIQSAQYKDNEKCFSYAFNGNNYFGIIITMLLKAIYNFLWTLLFIIPGIIKYYAYRMVPYILADNPNIGAKEAINLSNKMTDGHKFDMFVLDLSFIGWYILGLIVFFVGVFLVNPYAFATEAELYLVLRSNAIENDFCSYNDLLNN